MEGWCYCAFDEIPADSPIRAAHTYWTSRRSAARLPSRADFNPADIPKLLARTVLIDCLPDDAFKVRLMGSHVREHDGRELTGRFVESQDFGPAAPFFKEAFRRAVDRGEPIFFKGRMDWEERRFKSFIQGVFPLEQSPGQAQSLFCIVDFDRRLSLKWD